VKVCRNKYAFGLVEIVVAIAFFTFALLPLITLFSSNMDSLNVIQARSRSSLIAQELLTHAILTAPGEFIAGTYDLSGDDTASWPEFSRNWKLCSLPPNFSRKLIISGNEEPLQKKISASINNSTISQANISMTRTAIPFNVKED